MSHNPVLPFPRASLTLGGLPSVHAGPIARSILKAFAQCDVLIRYLGIERVVRLGTTEEGLQRDERWEQGERRRPVVLEDVEGDGAGDGRDVWVVDLGYEFHLGRSKGIVTGNDDVLTVPSGETISARLARRNPAGMWEHKRTISK